MASDFLVLALTFTQIHCLFAFTLTTNNYHYVLNSNTQCIVSREISHRKHQPSVLAVKMSKTLPRDIKETVNQLRQSMQSGLSARCSRMDIELPFAVNFGVERSTAINKDLQVHIVHFLKKA